VLLLGLLYHATDPVGLLRRAHALTRQVCVVETQVAPELTGELEWGAVDFRMPLRGCFALVDESAEVARGNREAGIASLSLVPSLAALLWLLRTVGFDKVEVLTPPGSAYEQAARGQRVVVAAGFSGNRGTPHGSDVDPSAAASSDRPVRR